MPGAILSYQQKDPIRLLCEIDLKKLFLVPKERERFNKKGKTFLNQIRATKVYLTLKETG